MVNAITATLAARAATADRRRASRRRLYRRVVVQLRGEGASGGPVCAALLNVSPHGMACRVAKDDLGVGSVVGRTLWASFVLTEKEQPFDLRATVTNATESALSGQLVLGIEFDVDSGAGADVNRLKAALAGMGKKPPRTGQGREGSVP